jgi:hypothetical protein
VRLLVFPHNFTRKYKFLKCYLCIKIDDDNNDEYFKERHEQPEDFIFELTKTEKDELVTNCDRLATKYDKLDALHQKANEPRKPIGFKTD